MGGADFAGTRLGSLRPRGEDSNEVGVNKVVQKIGMFVLVTFAIIALIREPETVAAFVTSIGAALQTIVNAIGQLFQSVQ